MTKPQIWVATFLVIFILLFILQKATKKEEHPPQMPTSNLTDQTTSENLTGAELFANFRCTSCHGNDYKGTKKGPALAGLGEHYSRKDLISYLRNPKSFMDSKRLKEYREQFPGIIMPSYSNKDVKELGKIADFLLGL
jgi:cytochrome c553